MNKLARYFDINASLKSFNPKAVALTENNKKARALPQWLALLTGVSMQPYFANFRTTGVWDFSDFGRWSFFPLIVAEYG